MTLRELLQHPEVEEVCELRSPFGIMAYHGGGLEELTDVIGRRVAEQTGSSYYGIHQPASLKWHVASHHIDPSHSTRLQGFLEHVNTVVTLHGYGRKGFFTSILLGGRHRELARHIAGHLSSALPAYDICDDLERIPSDLAGQHPKNPVNLVAQTGVQIELPPRVRGQSPLWWDWDSDTVSPHTNSLISALARAIASWSSEPVTPS
jgi:phage replication-related protein YjqB (UPF0714/DUF867 family)